MREGTRGTLLFLVTEDWYFVSHRLPLALAARRAGFDVCVVTRVRRAGDTIRGAGLRLIPFENERSRLNPLAELRTLWRLIRIYRDERPVIAHHVAMKPVLYGTLAAAVTGTRVVNAVAGMGFLFTSAAGAIGALRPAIRWALARALRRGMTIVQNPDDAALLTTFGVRAEQVRRIPGSGVDLAQFAPTPEPDGVPEVLFPARVLWDKGAGEFVAAARLLKRRGVQARLTIAGEPDRLNPAAVPDREIERWVEEGAVTYLGWLDDMREVISRCHVVCLPSYREGMPKSLLEAAAAGKPIVTTDVPGCRDVVRHGDNGLLVPPRNAEALAAALELLLGDAALRARMGARGRARAEQEFGLDTVIQQTLALYDEVAR